MESTPRLDETLVDVLPQQHTWLARRPLPTLAWMLAGRLPCGHIRLTAWAPSGHSRAVCAQRTVRRCARGRAQDRRDGPARDGPLLHQALAAWGTRVRSLALDPSRWWKASGLVRLARGSRGRAVPRVWPVWAHPSSRGASEVDNGRLATVAARLPGPCRVVLTAERGYADPQLRPQLTGLGGQWRRRLHGSVWLDRQGTRPGTVQRMPWGPGQALVWPQVASTTQAYGPVHRARGRPLDRTADGCGVREEPTASNTGVEDGRRFDSAEHCLDDHSHGLPRESALRRSAQAVARVCGGRARTTRSRVAQGTAVVHHGNRRGVDAHGCRGQSALNIGWNWVHLARSRGYERLTR
jgi:hypothetical protein